MNGHLFFQVASDAKRLLEPRMLPDQKEYAFVLELIIHDRLIVPGYTYRPLLNFTHEALAALLRNS